DGPDVSRFPDRRPRYVVLPVRNLPATALGYSPGRDRHHSVDDPDLAHRRLARAAFGVRAGLCWAPDRARRLVLCRAGGTLGAIPGREPRLQFCTLGRDAG